MIVNTNIEEEVLKKMYNSLTKEELIELLITRDKGGNDFTTSIKRNIRPNFPIDTDVYFRDQILGL